MNLSGSERKELHTAILDAYRSESALDMAVNFELDEKLNEIAGGENLTDVTFYLIQWAEKSGKLKDLIKALSNRNPGNEKLASFKKKFAPSIFDSSTSDSKFISVQDWNDLYDILSQIENGLISQICERTIRNIQDDVRANYLEFTEKIDLREIKEILLKKCPKRKDNVPTVIEFAERLSKEKISESLKNKLTDWVKSKANVLNIELPTYSKPPSNDFWESYLLVTLEPKGDDKVTLEAELIRNYNSSDFKKPIRLDLNDKMSKTECSFAEVADVIYRFIKISETKHLQPGYKLTIELFLPFRYLGKSLDLEKIPIGGEVPAGIEPYKPIGHEYRFLVRSSERFKKKNYLNNLLIKWKELEGVISNSLNEEDFRINIANVTQINCDWEELVENWNSEKKVGIKMVGCWSESDSEQAKLFFYIVRGGIPIALWTRCHHLPKINLDDELQNILTLKSLKDFNGLFESVWNIRRKAHVKGEKAKDYLGYHLGILCDNPNRVPFHLQLENQQLIETGL
ncbi:MAG: hypothetical protein DSM106950_22415 [Stigonema ocellatum SAG 48.90 = DSM 106950]|nr:hypothetical protein [Stigonema ocellatum SAG 48.90 = DSM 106950]